MPFYEVRGIRVTMSSSIEDLTFRILVLMSHPQDIMALMCLMSSLPLSFIWWQYPWCCLMVGEEIIHSSDNVLISISSISLMMADSDGSQDGE